MLLYRAVTKLKRLWIFFHSLWGYMLAWLLWCTLSMNFCLTFWNLHMNI